MGAKIFDGQKWVDVYDTIVDNYSLLLVSTTDESFIGKTVTVTVTGEGAKREEYTKRFTALNAQPFFRLNQLTTYSVTCGDVSRTIEVTQYANYTVEIAYWNGIAYDNGDEYVDVTGGWINNNAGTFTKRSDYLSVVSGVSYQYGTARTTREIDLTDWDYLKLDGYYDATTSTAGGSFGYGTASEMTEVQTFGRGRATHTIDIRTVTGSYYLHIGNQASANQTRAYKVWLEKEQSAV